MSKRFYPIIGLLVAIIPFLGIPNAWKHPVISFLGLALLFKSVWPSVSEKITKKPNIT